jgi:transcriptional regulator with XRE-family HTH domain
MPANRPSHAALAALLRGLSLAHGVTSQRELSEKVGISESRISKWMRAEVYMYPKSQGKVATFFGLTPDQFMERAWRIHRALEGEPEPLPEPDFEGAVEIAGYGERRRIDGVSERQMRMLIEGAEEMARP